MPKTSPLDIGSSLIVLLPPSGPAVRFATAVSFIGSAAGERSRDVVKDALPMRFTAMR